MLAKVPSGNVAKLETDLARLAKRAAKLGVPPPVVTWGAWDETVTYRDPLDPDAQETSARTSDRQVARVRRHRMVEVTGDPPRLAGWAFVAVIEHGDVELGNIVRALPDESCPPVYRESDPTCDHCHLTRKRSETFVVRHEAGRTARVGRQCLADYLGHQDPEALARAAEFLALLRSVVEGSELEGAGAGGERCWTVEDVIATTIVSVARDGWTSRSSVRDSGRSATADRVGCLIFPTSDAQREARLEVKGEIAAAAPEAEAIVTWARELGNGDRASFGDYLHNLRVVCSGAVVESRHLGIAVSAVAAYRRELGIAMEGRHVAVSQHVGTVGQRAVFGPLTVVDLREFEGGYGAVHLYVFADASGNRLKWFASRAIPGAGHGSVVALKATVKAHEVFRGVSETVLTRGVPCALGP